MAKRIVQYRYFNDGASTKNSPNMSKTKLISGSIFFQNPALGTITQLGIQALPGTKFYLNNSVDPVIIGSTGIYELDLEGLSEITALSFDSTSLSYIANNETAGLIVDAIYNVVEV